MFEKKNTLNKISSGVLNLEYLFKQKSSKMKSQENLLIKGCFLDKLIINDK